MPIYEYVCTKCGKRNEILQKLNDPTPEQCDSCGARKTLHRVVSRSSFHLRGGGWHSDLYASTKKPASDTHSDGKESKDGKAKDSTPPKESKGESKKPAGDAPPASSPAKSASPSPSTSTPPKKNEKAG